MQYFLLCIAKRTIFGLMILESKITYVFATASQFADDAPIDTALHRYKSNIAKLSLATCSNEIRTLYSDLLVWQVEKESNIAYQAKIFFFLILLILLTRSK